MARRIVADMFDSLPGFMSHGVAGTGFGAILVYLLVMTQLTILTVTLYLHRSQTHRSVEFHPALAHGFRFWSWLSTGMVTREWVAVHRKHHAHADTEQDPHSPYFVGIGKLLWQGSELYRAACKDKALLAKYGSGTPDDWIERHLYTPHCNWGPTLLAVVNLALFGVGGMAIWALQMMWIPFWGAGVVNGVGHWWGYRNFETADRSANLMPWAVWVGGEELHNNHHAFPGSAKFSVRRFEFDFGWFVIQLLAALRLAEVKRVACAPNMDAQNGVSGTGLSATGPQPATLAPRVRVMTEFFRTVMLPAVRAESRRHADILSRRLRRALADGGRWLGADDRARLNAWIEARPALRTLCEFRAQLATVLEQRGIDGAPDRLLQWARAAEASGIGLLRTFALALVADTLPIR